MAGNKREYRLDVGRMNQHLHAKGYDWSWVATAVDVDRRTVERWRDNGKPIRIKNIALLAKKMRLPIQEICAEPIPANVLATFEPVRVPPLKDIELDIPKEVLEGLNEDRRKQLVCGLALIIGAGFPVRFSPDGEKKS